MFRHWLHLPINFYFPTMRGVKKHQPVDHYITKLCEWLKEAFKKAQVQSTSEAERQKWYYKRKANAISLEPGNLVLAKTNTYRGRRKSEGPVGGRKHMKWGAKLLRASLPTSWGTSGQDAQESSTETDFFSLPQQQLTPLCTVMLAKQAQVHHHSKGANSRRQWD